MKKIIGIFIVMLLIITAIPSIGMINELETNILTKTYEYQDSEIVPGEFIVKFKESPNNCESVDKLNEKYKVSSMRNIFRTVENTKLENVYILSVPEDTDILRVIEEYSALDNVVYAEPDYYGYLLSIPNDEFFPIQWSLENTGQTIWQDISGIPDADISADEAWDIETGSEDIIIAVMDTGVDYTHPDLVDNIWINEDEIPNNEIDDDNNGYVDDYYGYDFADIDSDPIDYYGHGTHCAGTVSAISNNEIGITGVAWNCKIMPIKVFNSTRHRSSLLFWVEGMTYAADNGANVISISLGFRIWPCPEYFSDAVDYVYDEGVVMVAAAGNYDRADQYLLPQGLDKVISVAATNQNDERTTEDDWDPNHIYDGNSGSNYGDTVDVAAPGHLIYSTTPTYHVDLNDIISGSRGENYSQNYDFMGGTSMATPHVAGLAALILSKNPTYSPEEVRLIIRANTDPYISEEYIGTGRINAYKALMELNTQPDIPDIPIGPTSGRIKREQIYTSSATDPDGDDLWYFWDWGDENNSGWLGPYSSGETCEALYTWQQEANFSIRVKVKDGNGGESYWSESIIISMPKNKSINYLLLERLLSRFPILEFLV